MATSPSDPPDIIELPPAPNSATDTPTEFDIKANNTVAAQVNMVPQINTANDWVKTTAEQVYNNAVESEQSAVNSAASAASAASSASLLGRWEDLTGSASVGDSVYYLDAFWRALEDIPDITLEQPSSESTVWAFSSGSNWMKVTSSQDAISNSKMHVSATLLPVDLQLPTMSVNETFTVRNNSDSTETVRLLNNGYLIIGNIGSVGVNDNLIIPTKATRILICRDANILEIL